MTSQQAIGQQQKVGVGGQGSLGSTWSDPSVNINLDFLSSGLNPNKTPPTLNNIIQQQGIMFLAVIYFLCAIYTETGYKKHIIHGVCKSSKLCQALILYSSKKAFNTTSYIVLRS